MRPYRGKREDNGELVVGWYGYKAATDQHFIMVETLHGDSTFGSYFTDYEVAPDTVGQDSGVPDKNEKYIFAGDILKVPDLYETPENTETTYHYELVTYENGAFCANGTPLFEDAQYISDECEVVGNIHDHPHLLEGKTDDELQIRRP